MSGHDIQPGSDDPVANLNELVSLRRKVDEFDAQDHRITALEADNARLAQRIEGLDEDVARHLANRKDERKELDGAGRTIVGLLGDVEKLIAEVARLKGYLDKGMLAELAQTSSQVNRLTAERDHLKKCFVRLDRITRGAEETTGTEPEWIQEIVERWVKLTAERDAAHRDHEVCGKAYLKTIEQRDTARAEVARLRGVVKELGGSWRAFEHELREVIGNTNYNIVSGLLDADTRQHRPGCSLEGTAMAISSCGCGRGGGATSGGLLNPKHTGYHDIDADAGEGERTLADETDAVRLKGDDS